VITNDKEKPKDEVESKYTDYDDEYEIGVKLFSDIKKKGKHKKVDNAKANLQNR